jgi:hypothetical protein
MYMWRSQIKLRTRPDVRVENNIGQKKIRAGKKGTTAPGKL